MGIAAQRARVPDRLILLIEITLLRKEEVHLSCPNLELVPIESRIKCLQTQESDNKLEIGRWAQIIAQSVEAKERRDFNKKLKLVQVERNETCNQLYEMRVARLSGLISDYQQHVVIRERVTTVQRTTETPS